MGLPNPIPDNPTKWDGWRQYTSKNPYERLCLDFEKNPSSEQIEENCRLLFVWWQKKLPLKNQPSNPLAQMLRSGIDEAPGRLAEARTVLLDPHTRKQVDEGIISQLRQGAVLEFSKFIAFSIIGNELTAEDEEHLYSTGEALGLSRPEMREIVDQVLEDSGARRRVKAALAPAAKLAAPAASPAAGVAPASGTSDPRGEFMRILRLSVIDEMSDDQRDAFCNMGESLGLSGGDAEDVIDEYLEERMVQTAPPPAAKPAAPAAHSAPTPAPAPVVAPKVQAPAAKPAAAAPAQAAKPAAPASAPAPAGRDRPPEFANSPLFIREQRMAKPDFANSLGMPMLLVNSGSFTMGSEAPDAQPIERPLTPTNISAFFMAKWPVTNVQYEVFDPSHKAKRAPWADDKHPVVYVSHAEAVKFCEWLSKKEGKKYRLPYEAEWEYAARGPEGRIYPWGPGLDYGDLANFADVNKKLPWANPAIDTGFAATSPVGSFRRGAGPFGTEDMAGNVFEWCAGSMFTYVGKEQTNPKGANDSVKRIYRGGSWKSRAGSLRGSSRGFNLEAYSANDVGFRVVCEC